MSSSTRCRLERGATLVETAIVGLLVFTLILGVFEFGLLFRDNLTATDAVADAVRIGAIVGPDVSASGGTADFEIVRAIREGLASVDDSTIEAIVIFKAAGTGDEPESQMPERCRQGISVKDACNAYDPVGALRAVEFANHDYFTCDTAGEVACNWDPEGREDGPKPEDVESIGVYVRIEKDGYTGLFADSWTISRASVMRLEPGVTEP